MYQIFTRPISSYSSVRLARRHSHLGCPCSPVFIRPLSYSKVIQQVTPNSSVDTMASNITLINLPAEICSMIYECLLDLRSGDGSEISSSEVRHCSIPWRVIAPSEAERTDQLLSVCRTCYNEFLPLVYRDLRFRNIASLNTTHWRTWKRFLHFSDKIGNQACKRVRYLSLDIHGVIKPGIAEALAKRLTNKSAYSRASSPGVRSGILRLSKVPQRL